MEFLTALWMPILVTGIVLFFASFIAWTVLPHHQSDFKKLPDQEPFMKVVREFNIPSGSYMFPYMTHQEAKDPGAMQRYQEGPRGKIVLWDMPNMGRNLGLTFLYFTAVAATTAYVAWTALGPTAPFMMVFRIVGTIGILVYATSGLLNAVWFPRRIANDVIDGIVYGLVMGLIFAFLWPNG